MKIDLSDVQADILWIKPNDNKILIIIIINNSKIECCIAVEARRNKFGCRSAYSNKLKIQNLTLDQVSGINAHVNSVKSTKKK